MTRCLPLFLAVLFMACGASFAQSQSEMNRDAAAAFKKADAALNMIYAKAVAALDEEGVAKLKAAQRAWITFRDAQAELNADTEARGGSLHPLIYETSREALTKARIEQLKELLQTAAGQ